MRSRQFPWSVIALPASRNGWMGGVALSVALAALLALGMRGIFEPTAAAAQQPAAGKGRSQARGGPCRPDPLPPPFGFGPVAEFVITGAESIDPGESFVPAVGDGTFESGNPIFGLDIVDGVDVADLDRDGDLDFLIADGRFGYVYLYRNDGQGTYEPERVASGVTTPLFTVSGNSTNLRIADFNRDGLPDFVVGDLRIERGTKIYLQDRRGRFRISDVLDTSWNDAPFGEEGPFILGVAAGDMNGDGFVDIAMLGYEGEGAGDVQLYLGNGRGRFSEPRRLFNLEEDFGFNLNATGLAAFDLEGDGDYDLIVGAGDGNHYVYLNNGAGTFARPAAPAFVAAGQSGIDAYDADHDGDHDLVFVTIATTELFYVQNLGGTLASPVPVSPIGGFGVAVGAPPIPLTTTEPAR